MKKIHSILDELLPEEAKTIDWQTLNKAYLLRERIHIILYKVANQLEKQGHFESANQLLAIVGELWLQKEFNNNSLIVFIEEVKKERNLQ